MLANLYNRIRSGFVVGAIAALVVALPCVLFAQSPLTVQPSTGRVGIGNTNPSETLDVTGTVKATAFKGDGSQLTNLPIPVGADRADVQIFTTPGPHTWVKPLNAKHVFVYLIGGGGGEAVKFYSLFDDLGRSKIGARIAARAPSINLRARLAHLRGMFFSS